MRTIRAATFMLVALALAGASLAQSARHALDIKPQPMKLALRDLGEQTGIQILFRAEDVAREQVITQRVSGEMSPAEALDRMFEQAPGLKYEWMNPHTVLISAKEEVGAKAAGLETGIGDIRVAQGNDASAPPETSTRASSAADQDSASASANDESILLDEIVVTAQKRIERLQDVPVPVTAIDAQSLVDSNQLRLQDYYTKVPGLNFSTDNRGAPSMSIRGITTGAFVSPTVGFTVDDVPFGSSVAVSSFSPVPDIDPNDLARIEVLRGPQGTLYGSNSIGGLIKYVTIDPSTAGVSGRIQVGGNAIHNGDDTGYSVSGGINVPLSDTAAIRASAFTRQDPGYIDNVTTGEEDVNETQVDGARLSALWRASDRLTARFSAVFQQSEADAASQVHPGLGDWEQQSLGGLGGHERKVQAYSANLTAKLGKAELTSITGYNIGHSEDSYDVSAPFLGFLANQVFQVAGAAWKDVDNESTNFSQEFRLAMPLSDRVDWLLGLFYTDQDTDLDGGFFAIDPVTFEQVAQGERQLNAATYEEFAVFADVTFHICDRFDVQVGGRQSENDQTSDYFWSGPFVPILFGGAPDPFDPAGTDSDDSSFTYLVTPRWRLSDDLMVYARFASGYRPGGSNPPDGTLPPTFEPDRTLNYELGAKGRLLDGRLSYEASIYRIDWRDVQVALFQPAPPFFSYTDNAGRARSQGVEFSLEARPASGTRVSLWTAWNDSQLTEDFPANANNQGLEGDRLPYSTRFSGAFSVEQTFPLGTLRGHVGGAVTYVGEREGEFLVAREIYPSYTKVDVRAGVRAGSWSANLFVNNVTDKFTVLSGGAGIFPFSFTQLQPRTAGISIAKTFE